MKIPRKFKRTSLVVGAIGIQLIPVTRDNPPVSKELVWDAPETRALAQRACFDCHSHETKWPWYSYVAPVSWLIRRDVTDARKRLNFSKIHIEDRAKPLVECIQSGEMPLPQYLAIHPEARLTDAEKNEFIAGLRRSFELSGLSDGKASRESHEGHKHTSP